MCALATKVMALKHFFIHGKGYFSGNISDGEGNMYTTNEIRRMLDLLIDNIFD